MGITALHLALLQGRDEVAQSLLDAGADINKADKDGNTPGHSAAVSRRLSSYQWAVQHGLQQLRNNKDKFPWMVRLAL